MSAQGTTSSTTSSSSTFSPKTSDQAPALSTAPAPSASEAGASSDTGHQTTTDRDGLVNYYFVFLALLLCVVLGLLWIYYRRRQLKAYRRANSRQDALTRDLSQALPLEQTWRSRTGTRNGRTLPDDANEGLNEDGEAPPPYKARGEPAMPEPTLSRDQARLKPPDYE